MKLFLHIILLLFVFPVSISHAQTTLESNYVYQGKTLEYLVPKGFKRAKYDEDPFVQVYLLDTTGFHEAASEYFFDSLPFNKGIVLGYVDKEEYSYDLEFVIDNLPSILDEEFGDLIIFREEPEYTVKNGLPFATVKCNYPNSELAINKFKICAVEFGDYFFYFATFHAERSDDKLLEYLFDEMSSSIKIISTKKENTLLTWEDFDKRSRNNGVDTKLDTDKIHFEKESSEYWESWGDEDFLLHYNYGAPDAQIQGSVRLISAGIGSDGMTDVELVNFLKENKPKYPIENISFLGNVKGDSRELKKYSVVGSKEVLQLYTTEMDGELLLIFVIPKDSAKNTFRSSYEGFVKSMYITE